MISDPSLATRETLGAVREEEDRRSWVTLGRTPDRHEWLRYPDHGLADLPFDALVERVAAILREERPDVVITFGEDGITGHPDHITVGRAATAAFHALRAEGLDGFRRLIHVALPQSMLDTWNEQLIAQGREPMDPTQLYQPRGVPDASVGFSVDTERRRPTHRRRPRRSPHAGLRLRLAAVGGRTVGRGGACVRDRRMAAVGAGDDPVDRRVRGSRLTERDAR